ncbi:MAG: hypothetical protein ACUVUG_05880 [Candidatus Aminicenantia bacterium]
MLRILTIANLLVGTILYLATLLVAVISFREKERRAAFFSLLGFAFNCLFWTALILFQLFPLIRAINFLILSGLFAFVIVSWLKFFPTSATLQVDFSKILPFDERDHMFSRNALKFDEAHKKIYYQLHPEFYQIDLSIHAKPELGEPGSTYYHPYFSPTFVAAFSFLSRIKPLTKGNPDPQQKKLNHLRLNPPFRNLPSITGQRMSALPCSSNITSTATMVATQSIGGNRLFATTGQPLL